MTCGEIDRDERTETCLDVGKEERKPVEAACACTRCPSARCRRRLV
jgi:hypothetical protein